MLPTRPPHRRRWYQYQINQYLLMNVLLILNLIYRHIFASPAQVVRLLKEKAIPFKFHVLDGVKYRSMGAP